MRFKKEQKSNQQPCIGAGQQGICVCMYVYLCICICSRSVGDLRWIEVHLREFVIEARVWLNDCDLLGISNMQLTNSN